MSAGLNLAFFCQKTFGSIHLRYHNDEHGNPGSVTMAPVGTTAEIYEFRNVVPIDSNRYSFLFSRYGKSVKVGNLHKITQILTQ